MPDLKVIGIIIEQEGKIKFIRSEYSNIIDIPQIKDEPAGEGIADPITPEQEEKNLQSDFEEGLDKRLKRK